jgi:cell division protein FtsI/penicillin-binding protein 2
MSAFVVIGSVVVVVAAWVSWLSDRRAASQPERARETVGTAPNYSITDRDGRELARFVPRFDLELSPRSMWQAHTPDYMAERISETLGGVPTPDELLALLLPDAEDGEIVVDAWELSARQAHALTAWISGEGSERPPLEGMWVESSGGHGTGARGRTTWTLVWRPEVVLSREQREAQGCTSAWSWGRRLASGIAGALRDPSIPAPRGSAERDAMRAEVWSALVPRAWCRPLEGLPTDRVSDLRALLAREGVAGWQMRVAFGRDRFYPAGEHELFGSWGYLGPRATEPAPREGLELLCDRMLEEAGWDERLDHSPSVYHWIQDRTVRGQRTNGYVAFEPAAATPEVESTLDLALQRFLRRELEGVLDEHDPALAMGIVVDVESGDVLAVDSVEKYPVQPFAPIYHVFTTGSTLKVMTMACALEKGVVEPTELLDVGQGQYRVFYPDGRRSGRVIREAEGALTGVVEAREAFAFSVNAGLTQIGLRVPDTFFRDKLERLGYGRPAGSGLGSERAGMLVPLPWKYAWSHASICFGHEISTTAWQHASALATVVRGGEQRPLRILRAVEQGARRWELRPPQGERVFSEATCASVRDMMRFGAEVGTGDEVRASLLDLVEASGVAGDLAPEAFLDVGTKTGTAQKVGTELCVHVELAARERWREAGLPATRARFEELAHEPKPHRNCYTSSICVFGSRADDGRELMVFVAVEEPRGKQRFGSKVAGPAAARVLAEALGLTQGGAPPRNETARGFFESDATARNDADEPWRREARGW